MTLQQLIHLRAVLAHGGFGAAGRAVGVTQQAISRSVRLLEDELGLRLIERGSGGIALTPGGERVLGLAVDLLDQVESVRTIARDTAAPRPRLRVGMGFWYALSETAGEVLAALQSASRAEIELVPGDTRLFTAQLIARELDFALCAEPEGETSLQFTPLAETNWGVAVRRNGERPVAADWLWVIDASDAGDRLARRLAAGFGVEEPRIALRSGLPAFALRSLIDLGSVAAAPLSMDSMLCDLLGIELLRPTSPVTATVGLLRPGRTQAPVDWSVLEPALREAHAR